MTWSIAQLFGSSPTGKVRRPQRFAGCRGRFAPTVEALESRLVPTQGAFLQGTAFIDANANAILDAGDTYLAGATIQLRSSSGATLLATTTTDANGAYHFDDSNVPGGLAFGTYQLVELAPTPTYVNEDVQILSQLSPASRVNSQTIQVTIEDPSQVVDHFDHNGVGSQDTITFNHQASPGFTGQLVIHLTGAGGFSTPQFNTFCVDLVDTVNPGSSFPVLPAQALSALPNGGRISYLYNHYGLTTFPTNTAGVNQAEGLQWAMWSLEYGNNFQTDPSRPAAVTADMNFYLADSVGKSEQAAFLDATFGGTVTPHNGQGMLATDSLNFANVPNPFQNITISGTKYTDLTGNGFSIDDTALAGVTINLYQDANSNGVLDGGDGGPISSTVTAGDGSYSFGNLGPGTYFVQEVVPAGYVQTGGPSYYTVTAQSGVNVGNENFANFQLISISGTKYTDVTGNGFSADDTGLAGVTVNLFLNGGSTPFQTTVTGTGGSYSFSNLGPGSYSVSEVVPGGYTQTAVRGAATTGAITATSGQNSSGNDFDNFQLISISGTKYTDITGNGFSADDTGLAGVTVNLFLNGGSTPFQTTVTGTGGSYSFSNLGPGSYSVSEVVPGGYTQTAVRGAATTGTITATSGQNSSGNDFDNFQLISISGTKYTDVTGNGFSADDTGLAGVTVNLFKNGGIIAFQTTITGTGGSYSFTNLGPGSYSVSEVVPAGYTQTAVRGGAATGSIVASSGQSSSGNDFDNFQLISISGTKYTDITGNGFSADDTGLAGVTVSLFKNGGVIAFQTTITGTGGSYSFTNLGPGSYSVSEVVPAGYAQTAVRGGAATGSIVASSGQSSSGNDFDNFQLISISGTKYTDITGNGFSADDTGLAGVTVNLFLNGGSTPFQTTVTGTGGSYSFSNLGPGSYSVSEVVPGGYTQTAVRGGAATGSIVASSGQSSSGNDFDNFQLISISGTKYTDITGNGFSADDTGLAGVTVNLLKNGGIIAFQTTVTGTGGSYSFSNLGPGSYSVSEVVPGGYTQTAVRGAATTGTITATSGQNSSGNDFDNFQLISISGTKYTDITGNGFSADDTGLAGVTVNLFKNGGIIAFQTTITGTGGSYSFTNLGPGSYSVSEVVPGGYTQTAMRGGAATGVIVASSGQSSSGNDFDNFQLISISGTKYTDITGNGFSADDTGLAGVTVSLFKNGGVIAFQTTITGTGGSYSFTNLGPGSYSVSEVVPAGYAQTAVRGGAATGSIVASSGQSSSGNDFDNFQLISISGTKYTDITGNGFSADDTGLAGVTVNLFLNGGSTPFQTTVTGTGGSYSFSNLGPGSYSVSEVVPGGYTQTAVRGGAATGSIVASSGQSSSGNDFDNFQLISISGTKYTDITGNGFSADDTGLAGVTVNLLKNGGIIAFQTTVTGTGGSYSFSNLGPGSYSVSEVVPGGYTQTAVRGAATTGTITATSGQNSSGNDFDNFQLISISGTKYTDVTGNGFSADDTGLAGVTVSLFKNGGIIAFQTTITGTGGSYSFTNLGPGSYSVSEVVPGGYTQTAVRGGAATGVIVASSGQNNSGNDFDNFQLISISGTKYTDITGNGFSADDTGLAGVTINLYKNGGSTVFQTTVTGAGGSYSFTNLGPGTYSVSEVVPSGYTQTAKRGTGATATITASSGQNNSGNDFDNFHTISISGTKFFDVTGNGFSADDTGLAGVTINLFKDSNGDGVLTSADGAAVASKVTASDGTYSFTNVSAGTYFVQEMVPAGYVQTGGPSYYTVTATGGQNVTGENFDNFMMCDDMSGITNISYLINGTTTVTNLRGATHQGDQVQVTFTVAANLSSETLTLVSYIAPGPTFDANTASQQKIFDVATSTFGPGTHTLTVTIPDCYYQIDFVCGPAIDHFGPAGSNIFYAAEGRLFGADNGGTVACVPNPTRISGTKYTDLTGNGLTADDTPLGGVTINLYKDTNGNGTLDVGTDKLVATKITVSGTGNYTFSNLAAGATYFVQEVVPANSVQTGPIAGYYTVVAGSAGGTFLGDNFADFIKCDTSVVCYISYLINGKYSYSSLSGHTHQGDTVKVTFTVTTGKTDQVTLVSYNAPGSTFDANKANLQTIYQSATGTYTGGTHSLTITIPSNYYQIDFVCGPAIDHFGPAGSNIFYTPQGRLLGSDGGGTNPKALVMVGGKMSDGTSPVLLTSAANLHVGQFLVAVDNLTGPHVAAEQARIAQAIATLNAELGAFGVSLVEVFGAQAAAADIHLQVASTSVIGGVAAGVLGVTVEDHITLIAGWNWYLGANPLGIGARQYDFQTVVTHELGHALGLGHSPDPASVMYWQLAPGTARRLLSANDLTVIEQEEEHGPEPLMAAPSDQRRSSPLGSLAPLVFGNVTPAGFSLAQAVSFGSRADNLQAFPDPDQTALDDFFSAVPVAAFDATISSALTVG